MASLTCHAAGVEKRVRLERIVRPRAALEGDREQQAYERKGYVEEKSPAHVPLKSDRVP